MRPQAIIVALHLMIVSVAFGQSTTTPAIAQISIPFGSQDAGCFPHDDGVYSVSVPPYPLNTSIGIGHVIEPIAPGTLTPGASFHDHDYVAPQIPDPNDAQVTYWFDQSVVVGSLSVVQFPDGLTQIEGYVGNSLGNLSSVGVAVSTYGDISGSWVFPTAMVDTFNFPNPAPGTILHLKFRKTSYSAGWANFRIFPRDLTGTPFPAATAPGCSSSGAGQQNSLTARLEINGCGLGIAPGPFIVTTAPLQPLTFAWQGAPLMPIILVTGPMNPAPFTLPGFGTIHLGTPPLFNDVLVVFDGAHMSGGLQLTTSPTGTASQTVIVPAGTPPGTQIAVQGIVEQVAGTTTYGNLLTAAFRIDVN